MKSALLLFCLICGTVCFPSSIDWNYFSLEKEGQVYRLDRAVPPSVDPDFRFTPYVMFEVSTMDDGYRLTSVSLEHTASSFVGNWLEAYVGDVIDASTTRLQGVYFNHCKIDSEIATDSPIDTAAGSDLYLKFVVVDPSDHLTEPDALYGWVQLSVDLNGNVSLVKSALGLGGQPMNVGAIPEPTSGLLFVVGLSLLTLLRKKSAVGLI